MGYVKWVGWESDTNTWEPVEHLDECKEKLEEFERRWRRRQEKKEQRRREERERKFKERRERELKAAARLKVDSDDDDNGYAVERKKEKEKKRVVTEIAKKRRRKRIKTEMEKGRRPKNTKRIRIGKEKTGMINIAVREKRKLPRKRANPNTSGISNLKKFLE